MKAGIINQGLDGEEQLEPYNTEASKIKGDWNLNIII